MQYKDNDPNPQKAYPSAETQPSAPERQEFTEKAPNTAKQEFADFAVEQKESKENSEKENNFLGDALREIRNKLSRNQKKKTVVFPKHKDQLTEEIEKIMSEGLGDTFKQLDRVQQMEFKLKGEETAYKIRQILQSSHVRMKNIFRLLLEWLKMLPGINRFFLEQEAKIKAEHLLHLREKHKKH
ncbi:MAG: hypothetical protein COV59_03450 [Candidatus Magasanikbacteria bacterium CG11_big_fil_rev_8_21_14_0_20_39_34]|uniref:Uncharacterized protein n=1 Tax=Candidatus Magasanikbacteria bacterium CG11_big_fil_rev_8_21_14_0_20_39_34 TaxID=1974653 RepID=A0A2H0N5Q1_9BACT|nr:MAG: hypothetical protein COV59_03450 [Candidatus Magasanikbacteria bacterium CG11_big_fil_rev_8_21_14_0_20_39_34]